MNYNAFSLVEIRDWAIKMSKTYNRLAPMVNFNIMAEVGDTPP